MLKNSNNLPIALYGAGRQALWEKKYVESVIGRGGGNIMCFIDADVNKQGTQYLGLPVLSYKEAKSKYGDFCIYVTLGNNLKYAVMNDLLNLGFEKEKILNYEEREQYVGCPMLESQLCIDDAGLICCCHVNEVMNKPPFIKWETNMETAVSKYIDLRDRLINAVRNGETCECSGCCFIKYNSYVSIKKIKSFAYGFNHPCQLSCSYCRAPNAKHPLANQERNRFIQMFDYPKFMECLEKHNLLAPDAVVTFAAGEITINRRKDAIFAATKNYRWIVLTNALIFEEQIAKSGNKLVISVDSGTRETYKLVKGMDAFDKVWANIGRYLEYNTIVVAKYIFLLENSNDADVEGFIQASLKVGVSQIIISSDIFRQTPHTDEQVKLIAKMLNLSKANGILVAVDASFMPNEIERIEKTAMEANI